MSTTAPVPALLAGTWEPVRAELDAEPVPELVIRQTLLELTGDLYAVYFGGKIADRGHYVLTAAAPHHPMITLHGTEGPNQGRSIPAIYQLVGDRLRICYGLEGDVPEAFTTTMNSHRYLITYKRFI